MKRAVAILGVALFAMSLVIPPALAGEMVTWTVPKEKTLLWNGKDFTGWKLFLGDPAADVAKTWSVRRSVLRCEGRPRGYMRTKMAYADYHLRVEWRWPGKPGNNGVLVHASGADKVWPKSLECQLHSGNAGDFWVIGEGVDIRVPDEEKRRAKKREGDAHSHRNIKNLTDDSEKPFGEWNHMRVECRGDSLRVWVNDDLVNEGTKCTVTEGGVSLQSEGTAIEFRNIRLSPLED